MLFFSFKKKIVSHTLDAKIGENIFVKTIFVIEDYICIKTIFVKNIFVKTLYIFGICKECKINATDEN